MPLIAKIIRGKLSENYRCLYLNSASMVAGMRSYLAALDVDVAYESLRGCLVMSSERHHLTDGKSFSVDRLLRNLAEALETTLKDGYAGLWATGDMTWELGSEVGSPKLLEYEWRLEEFMQLHPELGGICQYHIDSLPPMAVRYGMCAHRQIFVNETLSLINPHYMTPGAFTAAAFGRPEFEGFIEDVSRACAQR